VEGNAPSLPRKRRRASLQEVRRREDADTTSPHPQVDGNAETRIDGSPCRDHAVSVKTTIDIRGGRDSTDLISEERDAR
jgi:hypothetical protein